MVKSDVMQRIYETRRKRLIQLIDEQYDGHTMGFASAAGEFWTRIYDYRNGGRTMSERAARRMEERLNLPPYWLDGIEIPRTHKPKRSPRARTRLADDVVATEAA